VFNPIFESILHERETHTHTIFPSVFIYTHKHMIYYHQLVLSTPHIIIIVVNLRV